MTQQQLADACGCYVTAISKLENGHRAISGKWLGLLSTALQVPKAALLRTEARDGTEPVDCDIVLDSMERTILRFWRGLPQEGQDYVLRAATTWAENTVRGGGGALSKVG